MRFGRKGDMKPLFVLCSFLFFLYACDFTIRRSDEGMTSVATDSLAAYDSVSVDTVKAMDSIKEDNTRNLDTSEVKHGEVIDTKNVHAEDVVKFAETLIGIPYRYGSTNPKVGFDCSGFITYVGKEIPLQSAKRGDIILFTGTDSTERFVGHMGIIVSNSDTLRFIHSTSGKQYGVTITPLSKYYQGRFVKTIRVFKQNEG
jgi:cell wall-associated NlpC family hydrolase